MRIGIYGGTFDPIHFGHLVLAEQSREQGHLDQVWFIPAYHPPNKLTNPITRFDQRVEMIQLAIAGNPFFQVNQLEQEREGPSYTVDTLRTLHQLHPENEYWYLLGSDTLADLPNWYQPDQLLALTGLLVLARPGTDIIKPEQLRHRIVGLGKTPIRIQVIESPLLEISSRDLRHRSSQKRTLRYFLPRAVEVYIQEKILYGKINEGISGDVKRN